MLKWTVTKRNDNLVGSLSSLQSYDTDKVPSRRSLGTTTINRPIRKNRQLRESRRKTLATTELHKRCLNRDKENTVVVATPHPYSSARDINSSTPFTKHEFALRDVANITPKHTPTTATITPSRKRHLSLSPVEPPTTEPKPEYASTLPTFDVEYSPCGIKTVPMIALRGLTIKDSYFKNPCYFRDELPATKRLKFSPEVTPLSKRLSELRFSKMSFKRTDNNNVDVDNSSVASSKELNDTELERMIDEILESSRKASRPSPVRRPPTKSRACSHVVDDVLHEQTRQDPVTDLNVFCDNFQISPNKAGERTIIVEEPQTINEREVRTPDSANGPPQPNDPMSCHLRRQRGVRRKCKMEPEKRGGKRRSSLRPVSSNTTESPQTPLNLLKSHSFLRKSIDHLACMLTPKDVGTESAISTINKNNGSKTSYESTPGIEMNDLQASSTPAAAGAQHAIRRCLTFSESPDSVEDSLDKRKSVASSTTSRGSKSSTIISGTLDLAIVSDEQTIQIHVIRCNDLCRPNGGSVNAYVKVSIISAQSTNESSGGFQRTSVRKNSARPFFDHKFRFERNDTDLSNRIQLAVWHRDRQCKRSEFLGCMSFTIGHIIAKELNGSYKLQPQSCLTAPIEPILVTEQLLAASTHDGTSIEDGITYLADQSLTECVPSNRQVSHQQLCDDPLFQRFLDEGETSEKNIPAIMLPPPPIVMGQTPLTVSKQLIQNDLSGYGFSILWTHPPRIEKVEPRLSADIAGLLPGDSVIFVGVHNIVTMAETQVLHLIRSQNGVLNLEIYRQAGQRPSNDLKNYLARLKINEQRTAITPVKTCSTALFTAESSARKRNPQIAFSEDVGQGVIV